MALSSEYSRTGLRVKTIRELLKIKSAQQLGEIIMEANDKLNEVFGMQLVKLPKHIKKRAGRTSGTQATQTTQAALATQQEAGTSQADYSKEAKDAFSADSFYILRNTLPDKYLRQISSEAIENRETAYRGVVYIIVSLIAFSGGSLEGPALTRHLNALELDQKLKQTSLLSIEDTLKVMQKQMYIEKETINVEGDHSHQFIKYQLGRRALREFTTEGLMKQCAEIMKDSFTEMTTAQLKSQFKHTALLSSSDIISLPSSAV